MAQTSKGTATRVAEAAAVSRESDVAYAWRLAMAHMQGDVPLAALDLQSYGPEPKSPPAENEIDHIVDDSFPASDPPSWTASHA